MVTSEDHPDAPNNTGQFFVLRIRLIAGLPTVHNFKNVEKDLNPPFELVDFCPNLIKLKRIRFIIEQLQVSLKADTYDILFGSLIETNFITSRST